MVTVVVVRLGDGLLGDATVDVAGSADVDGGTATGDVGGAVDAELDPMDVVGPSDGAVISVSGGTAELEGSDVVVVSEVTEVVVDSEVVDSEVVDSDVVDSDG